MDKLTVQRFHKGKRAKQDKLFSGFTTDRVTASQRSGETGQTHCSAVSQREDGETGQNCSAVSQRTGRLQVKKAAKRDKLPIQQFHNELGVRVTVGEIKELAKRDAPRWSNTTDTAIWTITADG